jgi:hypothetical protein
MKARYMYKYENNSLYMNWPTFKTKQKTITFFPDVLQQNRILIETEASNRVLVPFVNKHDQLKTKNFETPLSYIREESFIDPNIVKDAMLITGKRMPNGRKRRNIKERTGETDSIATV